MFILHSCEVGQRARPLQGYPSFLPVTGQNLLGLFVPVVFSLQNEPLQGWNGTGPILQSATLVFTLVRTNSSQRGTRPPFVQNSVSSGSRCGSTHNKQLTQGVWRFTIITWNSLKLQRSSVSIISPFQEP